MGNLGIAFIFVVSLCGLVSLWLFEFYRVESRNSPSTAMRRHVAQWEFSAQELGGFSLGKLALASVLGLFLELLMIRWVSSEIRIFAYFKNFVLIACFLGFGLGCYLVRRRINLLSLLAPLATIAIIVKLPWHILRQLITDLPGYIGATSEVNVWGVPYVPMSSHSLALLADATLVVVPIFALIAFTFIPIGQLVGWYLENAPNGIFGYTVNIVCSLVGIGLYTLLCFWFQPPSVWFLLAGAMLVWFVWPLARLRWGSIIVMTFCVALTMIGPGGGGRVYWSPYQKLTITPVYQDGELISYQLTTNGSWYQQMLNLSPAFVDAHEKYFKQEPVEWNPYNLPYHFYQNPPSVLVLGAGTGNDVAGALRNGAGHVTAVEIDPLILKLGQTLHFEKPYGSPRVKAVLNDARSYVETTDDRFDMVVFSLLDSHTNSSYYSNIRIDNYVYTVEALQSTKRLLKPDGIMVVKFQVPTPWIAGRLNSLLQTVFGHAPLEVQTEDSMFTSSGRFFITGSQARIDRAMAEPTLSSFVQTHQGFPMAKASLTTDDWPYFYQHEPGLPGSVIILSVVLILLCWFFMRQTGAVVSSIRWHFFFLGAGFLLLEAQIISKMALLFGTTWLVNSIVIAGLLVLIVASNFVVQWMPKIPTMVGYTGIMCTIAAGYFIPLERLFFQSIWVKALLATAVLCLPVFFAGIVFIRSFAQEGFRSEALGSNLLGALTGGMLESLSMWTGIRSLLIIAGLLYLASWWALGAQSRLEKFAPQADALDARPVGFRARKPYPTT
ncbi:MAG: methyltransferase domain-containing protein [Acidobacteriia bacterium]|nr:methyltransferase domain-containing protein [Terriglobia bacterium]